MKPRGFTLTELSVVMAILAVILFAVVARAREKAGQDSCLSNLKQIGLGFQMYRQDYDECWPLMGWLGSWQPSISGCWGGEIAPYITNTQVFICPSKAFTDNTCSYIYNSGYLGGTSNGTIFTAGFNHANIRSPATLVTTADSVGDGWWGLDGSTMVPYGGGCAPNANCRLKPVHNHGANFGFADGHAKWMPSQNWLPSQWNPTWTP